MQRRYTIRFLNSALVQWLTPPLLVVALYWPVLGLPFFWDDVPNFNFMAGRSLVDLWTSAAGFPYYRPLGFTGWRLLHWFFSPRNTVAHHALNLVVLVGDAWLVGALAARLARGRDAPERGLFAWTASTIMTAFPFAALAVPLVASLFHLLVALVVLGAAVALLEYMRTGRRLWAGLSLACAALAPFVHESGVAAGGMLAAVWLCAPGPDGARWWDGERRRGLPVVLAAIALNAVFVPLWLAVPKMRTGGNLPGGLQPRELWLNAVFFFVSATFPVQPLALRAQLDWGWVDVTAVLAVGGTALALAAALAWRAGVLRWLLSGLGYAGVGAVPAIVSLPFLYVIVSPRLMILGAPGVALLWGGAVVAAARLARALPPPLSRSRERGGGRGWGEGLLALFLTAATLALPVRHIVREVGLHVRALAPVQGMVRAVRANPEAQHLIVNPTTWLAMAAASYPIAHEGVVVFPEYVSPAQLAESHVGAPVRARGVAFPPVYTEPARHYFDVWGPVVDWEALAAEIRSADRVWLVTYGDGPLGFDEVGSALPQHTAGASELAQFAEGRVVLEAASARLQGGQVQLILDWSVREPTGEEVFAHALDCAGNVLGLADGPPVGRMYPFGLWLPDERMRDLRTISLSDVAPDGCHQVEVGLFNPTDGSRPPAYDASGQRLANDALYLGVSN